MTVLFSSSAGGAVLKKMKETGFYKKLRGWERVRGFELGWKGIGRYSIHSVPIDFDIYIIPALSATRICEERKDSGGDVA